MAHFNSKWAKAAIQDEASGAYSFLRKEGVDIRELISPVDSTKWDVATIAEEAYKYSTRNEFKHCCTSA